VENVGDQLKIAGPAGKGPSVGPLVLYNGCKMVQFYNTQHFLREPLSNGSKMVSVFFTLISQTESKMVAQMGWHLWIMSCGSVF